MARTVRTKVFKFDELGNKAKETAKTKINILAMQAYEEEFWTPAPSESVFKEWKTEHFNINDYEFTQEGNIFFK